MKTQKFTSFESNYSFQPCRLVYFSGEKPEPKSGAEYADKKVETKNETLTDKQTELKDNLQKAEQKVAELQKKVNDNSADKAFQDLLASKNIDANKQLQEATQKIGEVKASLEKAESEKNNSKTLEEIQKVLAPIENAVASK